MILKYDNQIHVSKKRTKHFSQNLLHDTTVRFVAELNNKSTRLHTETNE